MPLLDGAHESFRPCRSISLQSPLLFTDPIFDRRSRPTVVKGAINATDDNRAVPGNRVPEVFRLMRRPRGPRENPAVIFLDCVLVKDDHLRLIGPRAIWHVDLTVNYFSRFITINHCR